MSGVQHWDEEWDESGHEVDVHARAWGPHEPFGTEEAARIGLDRNTVEGAQVAFFSHLDGRKLSHRLTAVVALTVITGWPTLPLLEHLTHL